MADYDSYIFDIDWKRYNSLWDKGITNLNKIDDRGRYLLFRTWNNSRCTVQSCSGAYLSVPSPLEVIDWYCVRKI